MTVLVLLILGCGPRALPDASWDVGERDRIRLDLVEVMVEAERYDEALVAVGDLRSDGVEQPRIDLLQARALTGNGRHREAIELLGSVRKSDAERWEIVGHAHYGLGDLEGAISAFRQALQHADSDARSDLYNNLGFSQLAAGEAEDALASYEEALRLTPSSERIQNNLGFALAQLSRDEEAYAVFETAARNRALSKGEASAEAWYNLGVARALRADEVGAREAWNEALAAWPEHGPSRSALATRVIEEAPTDSGPR